MKKYEYAIKTLNDKSSQLEATQSMMNDSDVAKTYPETNAQFMALFEEQKTDIQNAIALLTKAQEEEA